MPVSPEFAGAAVVLDENVSVFEGVIELNSDFFGGEEESIIN